MRGHEEASGTKYVPQELLDLWAQKDPISNFEVTCFKRSYYTTEIDDFKEAFKNDIQDGLATAFDEPAIIPDLEN